MKQRTSGWQLMMVVGGLLLGGAALAAGGGSQAPATSITIDGKKPVEFSHAQHIGQGMACGVCHHDAEHQPRTGEAIAALNDPEVLACVGCHNPEFADPKLQTRKGVFHARCLGCHTAGLNGKKGPTKCTACHGKPAKTAPAVEGC